MLPSPRIPRDMLLLPLLAVLAAWPGAAAAQAPGEPHYWKQPLFFIPYQPNAQDPQADRIDKVQLLVSRDGGREWAVLQEAEPHVRGFSYHAAADGDYAFAVRMADRRGKFWPEQIAQPLLRVVVDTAPPTLELTASLDASGQLVLRYEARDAKLQPESLRVEVQAGGGAWQRLASGPPEMNQPDRVLGQLSWRPPTAGSRATFRAAIDDAAGNTVTSTAEGSLAGPLAYPATGPQLAPPNLVGPTPESHAARPTDAPRQSLEWPTGAADGSVNSWASTRQQAAPAAAAPPDPFAPRGAADVAAPSLISVGSAPRAIEPTTPLSGSSTQLSGDGWVGSGARDGARGPAEAAPAALGTSVGAGAAAAADDGTPWVNSLTFDVDYDIQTVGPWGVAKVELWGSRDGGREWLSLGVDPDNRSPMRVTVPAQGEYGFRIVIDGGNGVAAPKPQPGDRPELAVSVDLTAPRIELRPAELGQAALAGHVIVRWTAEDERLAARPAGLFYSASAEGPWTTIATDLDNTGEYVWRLGRDVPPRVVLRLEVRDAAGNVAVQQTPAAVDLNLPRPTGRLRNVRPVQDDPGQFRTAAGARAAGG